VDRAAVAGLHARGLNFDPARRSTYTPEHGWHVDHYRQPLPPEPPGPPAPGGSWEIARRLACAYEFADPRRVRAFWEAGAPLAGRDVLLEVRFWGLRFRTGVRVGDVLDDERLVDGRPVRLWGWGYRTLEGHLERGQMDYSVWKWRDTGEVEFRVHAYSRRAHVPNPLVRLGFRLFGRREQVRFARSLCRRMAALTAAVLAEGPAREPQPERRDGLVISPSTVPRDEAAREAATAPAQAAGLAPPGSSHGPMK
jgi:uncharacterized protein (UPF0548 family)